MLIERPRRPDRPRKSDLFWSESGASKFQLLPSLLLLSLFSHFSSPLPPAPARGLDGERGNNRMCTDNCAAGGGVGGEGDEGRVDRPPAPAAGTALTD